MPKSIVLTTVLMMLAAQALAIESEYCHAIQNQEAQLTSSREPDGPLETAVRLVCGALSGALFGFWIGLRLDLSGLLAMLGITMAFCLVFAVCAVRYGDDFWYALLRK